MGDARRAVLVMLDGLRRDLIDAERSPNGFRTKAARSSFPMSRRARPMRMTRTAMGTSTTGPAVSGRDGFRSLIPLHCGSGRGSMAIAP